MTLVTIYHIESAPVLTVLAHTLLLFLISHFLFSFTLRFELLLQFSPQGE